MKLRLDKLPPSLQDRREMLGKCLEAIDRVRPVRSVYLFGSHARGQAQPNSDVDLCIVAEGAERQLKTAAEFRRAIWALRPWLSFTLVPITPRRLEEKKSIGDHFFLTILKEGVELADSELSGIRSLIEQQLACHLCRSKLAEILEKILKAELLRCGWFLEKTHDLVRLIERLEQHSPELVPSAEPLALALAESYSSERYPGFDLEEPDWPELQGQAEAIGKLLIVVKAKLKEK